MFTHLFNPLTLLCSIITQLFLMDTDTLILLHILESVYSGTIAKVPQVGSVVTHLSKLRYSILAKEKSDLTGLLQ